MFKHSIIAGLISFALFQSGLLAFLAPVPVCFLFAVYGRKQGYLSALIFTLLAAPAYLAKLIGAYDAAYLVYVTAIAIMIGELLHRKSPLKDIVVFSVVVPAAFLALAFVAGEWVFHAGLIARLKGYFDSVTSQVLSMPQAVSAMSAQQIAMIKDNAEGISLFALSVLPSMVFIFNLVSVAGTLFVLRRLTKRFGSLKYFGNVATLQFPFWPVWMLISAGALYFIDAYVAPQAVVRFVAINALIVCAGIFFMEGCFVVSFWLNKGRSLFLRLAVYGMIIAFLQVVGLVIIALGLSDQWIDFRKRSIKHSTTI